MDEWVIRALARWPNVPALFGWLGLDRRGRWLVKGETISHARIIETINRNYARDEHGRWFFQNGPQRGYVSLASAPFVLRVGADLSSLVTHTNAPVADVSAVFLDETGSLLLATEHGPGELASADLDWALERLRIRGEAVDEDALAGGLARPSGSETELSFNLSGRGIRVVRLDYAAAPAVLGFVREPIPLAGERTASGAPD